MSIVIRMCGVVKESIVDGPGLRYVIFVQGCPHKCKGCHNPESHDFNAGTEVSVDAIFNDILKNPLLSGVTFSGGEPFCQAETLALLAHKVKSIRKHVMVYTGYTIEELAKRQDALKLLQLTDTLVDGRFIEELKDYRLIFRGSNNQRIIQMKDAFNKIHDAS